MNKVIIAVVVLLAMVIGCAVFSTSIPEGHVGVVTSFGATTGDVLLPGFHLMSLFKGAHKMDTRWQKYTITTSAFSKDMQQVDIKMSMSFSLQASGALEIYKTVGTDYADKIMLPTVLDALKGTFANYSAEELVSKRASISDEVFIALRDSMEFYSISVREVAIEDIDFTDAFTDAIEAKQVATQRKLQVETEQQQQTSIAKAEAEREKIAANTAAEKTLIDAKASADAKKIEAEAEAYRLESISKNTTWETLVSALIARWNGELPTVVSDDVMNILPLDMLQGAAQ